MRKLLCSAVFAFYAAHALGADPRWIRMPSEDFEIFSAAGEGDTRRTLQNFERVRLFFEQALGGKVSKTDPVRIIVFGSKKEYLPYRPNEVAVAFYTQISGRDYIVMGDTGDEVFPVAVHEYVHLVTQHAGFNFPPWFNEGIAEIYSTMKPQGDKLLVGNIIPGRMQALLREKWVPLDTIVSADHNSPYYNEKNKAGSLYNEGWALVHMLELSKEYHDGFMKFFQALEKGTPSKEALETAYGKPLMMIDRDLQSYIRSNTFYASVLPFKLQSAERVTASPANLFDVRLALADLLMRPGKEAESRSQLEALATEDPKRPEPHVALGYLALRDREVEEARTSFQKAVDLGSQNPQMLWDYGRMAMSSNPPSAINALSTLLAAQPNRFEVRLALAQTQMNARKPADVLETMKPMKSVSPKDAEAFFKVMTYANLQLDNREAAKSNAQQWLKYAKEPTDVDNATKIVARLNSQEQAAQQIRTAPPARSTPEAEPSDERPDERRTPLSPQEDNHRMTPRVTRPFIAGSVVELDCKNNPPTLVLLQPGKGRVGLLMDQPRGIVLSGLKDAIIDMNCGPQKPVSVWVEYDPADSAQLGPTQKGIAGLVRAIHYEPLPGAPAEDSTADKNKQLKTR